MDHEESNALAEPAVTGVKSPSYSPQLDDEDIKPDVMPDSSKPVNGDVTAAAFDTLIASLPPATATPIKDAYANLFTLYQYTLGRLQLLELIGANGILTDALVVRLQQLNEENERLLDSERANRAKMRDLNLELEGQLKQAQSAEAALHDAHQLLQQQEHELAAQTEAIEELKRKVSTEPYTSSLHGSNKADERHTTRSRHEGSSRGKESERHRDSSRSHRTESRRHRERGSDSHRHERESSTTSSRRSSSRKDDDRPSRRDRDQSRVDRIREDEENEDLVDVSHQAESSHHISEKGQASLNRGISINGAASKSATGLNGGAPSSSANDAVKVEAMEYVEEDYEPEIDLGEDLLLEEEEAPLVKPAPPIPVRSRSRSPDRRRRSEGSNRLSGRRTRSRSPRPRDRRSEGPNKEKDLVAEKNGDSQPSPADAKGDEEGLSQSKRDSHHRSRNDSREDSASGNASRNRNNMYGRLGLPISGSGNEGSRSQISIRGAGRSTNSKR